MSNGLYSLKKWHKQTNRVAPPRLGNDQKTHFFSVGLPSDKNRKFLSGKWDQVIRVLQKVAGLLLQRRNRCLQIAIIIRRRQHWQDTISREQCASCTSYSHIWVILSCVGINHLATRIHHKIKLKIGRIGPTTNRPKSDSRTDLKLFIEWVGDPRLLTIRPQSYPQSEYFWIQCSHSRSCLADHSHKTCSHSHSLTTP